MTDVLYDANDEPALMSDGWEPNSDELREALERIASLPDIHFDFVLGRRGEGMERGGKMLPPESCPGCIAEYALLVHATHKREKMTFDSWYKSYLSLPDATAESAAKAAFRAGHGATIATMERAINRFNEILDTVEIRCMAVDGPVTPTLQEITEKELSDLWKVVQVIRRQTHKRETNE
jgi:hypothetical protein